MAAFAKTVNFIVYNIRPSHASSIELLEEGRKYSFGSNNFSVNVSY